MLTPIQYGFLALAAVAAGLINALAGGGSLITFQDLNNDKPRCSPFPLPPLSIKD